MTLGEVLGVAVGSIELDTVGMTLGTSEDWLGPIEGLDDGTELKDGNLLGESLGKIDSLGTSDGRWEG